MRILPLFLVLFFCTAAFGQAPLDPVLQKLIAEYDAAEAQLKEAKTKRDELERAVRARASEMARIQAGLPKPPPPPAEVPEDEKSLSARFWSLMDNHVNVRQSVVETDKIGLPALFQYTLPAEGDSSYLVDMGIAYQWHPLKNRPSNVSIYSEYHYNDALGAAQDTFLAGADFDFLWTSATQQEILDMEKARQAPAVQTFRIGLGYKQDNLLTGRGTQANLLWLPDFPGHFGAYHFEKSWINGRFEPAVGFQFETGDGASPLIASGERATVRASLGIQGLLFKNQLGNRLQYNVGGEYWHHFSTSGVYDAYNDNQVYFTSGLTYWLNTDRDDDKVLSPEEQNIGLSVKYANGDNPTQGAFDMNVWTFGLSVFF